MTRWYYGIWDNNQEGYLKSNLLVTSLAINAELFYSRIEATEWLQDMKIDKRNCEVRKFRYTSFQ